MTENQTEKKEKSIGYKKEMRALQGEISLAAQKLKESARSLIVVAEGLDASGKSGALRRITKELDAKQYKIVPISAPGGDDASHHYLWRFWKNLPARGNIVFFDRSWYGRVLVEKIEGFCTEEEWRRAYSEINNFEKLLFDDGAVIVKLWFEVSDEEQLKRFKKRTETPEKAHKITEEDWRNRAKRSEYDAARDYRLRLTNTSYAPWHVIEADRKKNARLEAARLIVSAVIPQKE